jgi:alpha,alpha-trehalase
VLQRNPDKDSGTLIPLPYPYIVPGGRFREIYYWDSYFTMLGLKVSGKNEVIESMIHNFSFLINTFGFIPNGNRTYYLSRSQPPFFSLMTELLASIKGDVVLLQYSGEIEKEYAFWMNGSKELSKENNAIKRVVLLKDGSVLNRYFDDLTSPRPEAFLEDMHLTKISSQQPENLFRNIRAAAESGWDFSSRWFKDEKNMHTIQTTDLIPVDLNCLLFHIEQLLSKIYLLQHQKEKSSAFEIKSINRKKAIETFCWNQDNEFYFDYNFKEEKNTNTFSLAAAYPLFFSISNSGRANAVKEKIFNNFLQAGGVITTLNTTQQQWDAPNGWAPLQWITYKALKNYGFIVEANELKKRWITTNEKIYTVTEKMMEKYNVTATDTQAGGGEYPNQDGFGWTNGVYLAMQSE